MKMALPTNTVPSMFIKTEGMRTQSIKIEPVSCVTAGSSAGSIGGVSQISSDIIKFYQEQGFESIAKEAGIVETTEELVNLSHTSSGASQPPKSKMIKLIAIPVSSTVRQPLKVIPRPIIVSGALPPGYTGQTVQRVAVSMPQRTNVVLSSMQQLHHHQQQQQLVPRFQTIRPQQTTPIVSKVIQLIASPAYSAASQQYTQSALQQQHLQTIQQQKQPQQQQQQQQQQPTVWTVTKRPLVTHYQTVPPPATTPSTPASSFAMDSDFIDRRKKGAHGGKGLRHFSMKVCEKVQRKGITSYNEVADELVSEFTDICSDSHMSDHQFDQKNIRRRVYDALNVLMAMNIISKEKKEIRWIGLPTNSAQECQNLELEKQKILERIQQKRQQLNELVLQQIAFKNLVQRNQSEEESRGGCGPAEGSAIKLPFILIHTSKKTVIDCSISSDKYEYLFNFDQPFEIHDDIEVLKRMGLAFGLEKNQCSRADLQKALKMVPKSLEPYVMAMAGANGSSVGHTAVSVKSEPGLSNDMMASTSRNLSDHMLDREVAIANASGYATLHSELSRQSSFGSASDLPSTAHDTPDYSDNTESDED